MTSPAEDPAAGVAQVVAAIAGGRYTCRREVDFQAAVAAAVEHAGLPAAREVRLSPQDRLDLLCGTVAIEVKTTGPVAGVLKQLQRYAAHEQVTGLVLATTRVQHGQLPDTVSGKPLAVVLLRGGMA